MLKIKKGIALITTALLISGLSACGGSSVNTSLNTDTSIQSNQNLATGQSFNTEEARESLISFYKADGIFNDSEKIFKANDKSGLSFNTKANNGNGKGKALGHLKKNVKDFEKEIENNKVKVRTNNQVFIEKTVFNISNVNIVYKNDKVLISKPIIIDNGDGTLTKTYEVEFNNRNNVKINKISVTYDEVTNNVIKVIHNFQHNLNRLSKEAVRVIIYNDDNTKEIYTETTLNLPNGNQRIIKETKVVDLSGLGDGAGTITVTYPDGRIVTYEFTTDIDPTKQYALVIDPLVGTKIEIVSEIDGDVLITENGTKITLEISDYDDLEKLLS